MPLRQEGGETDKLDKPPAHPSTWKVAGVNGEEKGGKQSKSWFVLMVYLRINKSIAKHYVSCPFPSKEGRGGEGTGVEVVQRNN